MREVHFQTLDLNLLRVFDALAEERSVTRAGERLGLTQSAVSHALSRLRYALEDELFLRGPDGMTATPRAMEIWPDLKRGLLQLQHALAPSEFTPAEEDRIFQISASSYTGEVLMPKVVELVRRQAPLVQLRVQAMGPSVAEALETRRIDLAVGVFGRAADIFAREPLFEDRLVWAMRCDHPAARDPMPVKELQKLPLVVLSPGGDRAAAERSGRLLEPRVLWDELTADQTPMGRGARQRIRVMADNAHAALAIIAASDLVGMVPLRLARAHARTLNLMLIDPPETRSPAPFEMVWRADLGSHPALDWLRDVMRQAARET
jgi:DNA-binding transcriptional LysR family regulator